MVLTCVSMVMSDAEHVSIYPLDICISFMDVDLLTDITICSSPLHMFVCLDTWFSYVNDGGLELLVSSPPE